MKARVMVIGKAPVEIEVKEKSSVQKILEIAGIDPEGLDIFYEGTPIGIEMVLERNEKDEIELIGVPNVEGGFLKSLPIFW